MTTEGKSLPERLFSLEGRTARITGASGGCPIASRRGGRANRKN